jgi:membrane-associated phospholipid phosphatase
MRLRVGESGHVEVRPDGASRFARRGALIAAAACVAVLVVLGLGVATGFGPQLRLDGAVSHALYAGDSRSAAVNDLLQVLTAPGLTVFRVVVLLPAVVWLVLRRFWWTAAWVLTAIVLVAPLTTAIKELVGRVRPDFVNGGARLESLSFPSGHSSGSATLVTVVLVLAWPLLGRTGRRVCLALGIALAVLVGLTRMWLGVHFLSDVLGGWALGVAWTLTVALAFGALPGGRAALPARRPAEVT